MKTAIMNNTDRIVIIFLMATLCLIPSSLIAYKASDYHWLPPFSYANEIPSVTIIFDSSSSMHRMAYARIVDENTPGYLSYTKTYGEYFNYAKKSGYYGYFKNNQRYSYNDTGQYFYIPDEGEGDFDGDFMNWATMHRIDVMRLALTGGNYTTSASGNFLEVIDTNRLKTKVGADYSYEDFRDVEYKVGNASGYLPLPIRVTSTNASSITSTNLTSIEKQTIFLVQWPDTKDLYIYNSTNNPRDKNNKNPIPIGGPYTLRIKTNDIEKGIFDQYKNEGDKIKARFALFRYYPAKEGTEENEHGGAKILDYMSGTNTESIKYHINTLYPSGAAPLAEALFTSIGYIQQYGSLDQTNGPRYASDAFVPSVNNLNDPFYFEDKGMVSCTQQNIILITPGESTFGDQVPVGKTNIVPEINPYPNADKYVGSRSGKYYVLDVAKWAHETDLRATTLNDLEGMQNTQLFVLYAFGKNSDLLKDAATYGGSEDNYFEAESGSVLKQSLEAIVAAATRGTMSGTAAAVTSQTRAGEGAAYQAIFFPPTNASDTDRLGPDWSGQVHAFLVDTSGNLHEDSDHNGALNSSIDHIIEFKNNLIYRKSATNSSYDPLDSLQDIKFLWSSTPWLNELTDSQATLQRADDDYTKDDTKRYIFTSVNNGAQVFSNSSINSNKIENASYFESYLTLFPDTGTVTDDEALQVELATRQINFIRGAEITSLDYDKVRSRKYNGKTWRLGDIVYSSPTVIGSPQENYHILYQDKTYADFFRMYKNRRQMVYVGANDGMLHAFNAGIYTNSTGGFQNGTGTDKTPLGMEMWAYVPFNLLPHLRWLMEPTYGAKLHVPYMDLKPRVFDARIFFNTDGSVMDNATHPNGWGTILVAGMRFGGGFIETNNDKTGSYDTHASSAYVVMDITNPEVPPTLLGEIRTPNLGFTTSYPTVMPMATANTTSLAQNKWYLVFGSGPADENGRAQAASDSNKPDRRNPATSAQSGKLYIVDLVALAQSGDTVSIISSSSSNSDDWFTSTEPNSTISDPVAIDVDYGSRDIAKEFKTDIIYFGTAAGVDPTKQTGTLRRIFTQNNQTTDNWVHTSNPLISVPGPVTAEPNVAMDDNRNLWIYFGTGRFFTRDDIPQSSRMTFYGVKENAFNGTSIFTTSPTAISANSLYDSTNVELHSPSGVTYITDATGTQTTWSAFTADLNNHPGWKFNFTNNTIPYERVLGQAAILGGAVLFTSYTPDIDICKPEGSSRLYALYYKTGTPYPEPIISPGFDKFVDLGLGVAITPNIHVGENGPTAFIQTSTGAIKTIQIVPPINIQPGVEFWRKNIE